MKVVKLICCLLFLFCIACDGIPEDSDNGTDNRTTDSDPLYTSISVRIEAVRMKSLPTITADGGYESADKEFTTTTETIVNKLGRVPDAGAPNIYIATSDGQTTKDNVTTYSFNLDMFSSPDNITAGSTEHLYRITASAKNINGRTWGEYFFGITKTILDVMAASHGSDTNLTRTLYFRDNADWEEYWNFNSI